MGNVTTYKDDIAVKRTTASLILAFDNKGLLNGPTVHAINDAPKSRFLVLCYGLVQIDVIPILQSYFVDDGQS